MNETWKNTFDQIHAEPELKEHTKEYLSEKVYRVHDRRVSHFRRLAAASVLCGKSLKRLSFFLSVLHNSLIICHSSINTAPAQIKYRCGNFLHSAIVRNISVTRL